MPMGRVKWFNNSKGYGFILAGGLADGSASSRANSLVDAAAAAHSEAPGEDLFVHYSSIQMEGYRTLRAGELVQFDTQPATRGMHAINVRRIAEPADDSPPIASTANESDAMIATAASAETVDSTR